MVVAAKAAARAEGLGGASIEGTQSRWRPAAQLPCCAPRVQVDVFAYEYSGYGHATGKPCEENLYSDARAALACLRDGFKLKPERDIVLYGKSLGSCPTSHLASRCAVRGVIIVSGLASGARVLFPTTKVYLTDAMFFNNVGRLATNTSPVQLIHGTQDEVIPFSNGQDLHAACNGGRPPPLPSRFADPTSASEVFGAGSPQPLLARCLAPGPPNLC